MQTVNNDALRHIFGAVPENVRSSEALLQNELSELKCKILSVKTIDELNSLKSDIVAAKRFKLFKGCLNGSAESNGICR